MNIYEFIKEKISPINSPIIFELGVNLGQDTVKIFELCKNPQYYAFEPDSDHFDVIKKIFVYDKIKFFPYAIGKENGKINLYRSYVNDKNVGASSILKPKSVTNYFPHIQFPENKNIEINICCLDEFCKINNVNHINFIWADIQGAEGDMILGGQEILNKTKYLYTEYCNKEYYEDQKTLNQLLNILPGKWKIVYDFVSDVLFENLDYK
jgi:FkbM family methyltransferase